MWKPVVCAVQGMCTAGAFYFVNESDVVICSDDATFFDSHVSAGLVCALEPIGLMRRVGLGDTLRIALMGNDERVSARHRAADRPGDRGGRGRASSGRAPTRSPTTIAAKPPSATQGTVKAIWESLDKPYRAAMEQNLIYTRLGNPLGQAELAARSAGDAGHAEDAVMADHPLSRRIADVLDLRPDAPAIEYDGRWLSWGQIADSARRIESLDVARAPGSESSCATPPPMSQRSSAC